MVASEVAGEKTTKKRTQSNLTPRDNATKLKQSEGVERRTVQKKDTVSSRVMKNNFVNIVLCEHNGLSLEKTKWKRMLLYSRPMYQSQIQRLTAINQFAFIFVWKLCKIKSISGPEVESRTQGSRPRPRTQKNPRPRTDFPRTDTLEAKDRNARGQRPRTKDTSASALQTKKVFAKIFQAISKTRSSQKFFR